jgi:hypothetical protein
LIDTVKTGVEPTDADRAERIALIRLHYYCKGRLCVTDKVIDECRPELRLKNPPKELDRLYETIAVVGGFAHLPTPDRPRVKSKGDALMTYHKRAADCQILAEAIIGDADFLLTNDGNFINHLSKYSGSVRLMRPSDCWKKLRIPPGASLAKELRRQSPLSKAQWWRCE